ncbi:hypothetical protein DFP72DRAFT_402804 [Ephemerocybe angulata]|uniref:Uncharacterized protein n=1 Tax=Ephemerocybe angulata TaxID=980116 RepID=A0A8H6HWQ8_9AGAR|nr:hypothetical protein DFP72DRAFT_402804 [Tulosesus angulatus]
MTSQRKTTMDRRSRRSCRRTLAHQHGPRREHSSLHRAWTGVPAAVVSEPADPECGRIRRTKYCLRTCTISLCVCCSPRTTIVRDGSRLARARLATAKLVKAVRNQCDSIPPTSPLPTDPENKKVFETFQALKDMGDAHLTNNRTTGASWRTGRSSGVMLSR